MTKAFNGLTHAEAERLHCLAEELGEAQHEIFKILRHGYASSHPDGGPPNRRTLQRELGHVQFWIGRMCEFVDLDEKEIKLYAAEKRRDVDKYLHHQGDRDD